MFQADSHVRATDSLHLSRFHDEVRSIVSNKPYSLPTVDERALLFELPDFLERYVIVLRGGYEIYSGLKRIVTDSPDPSHLQALFKGIVCRCEKGEPFSNLLLELAQQIKSTELRSTLLFMEISHRNGGDLISPITELAENSHLAYQDLIDEQIAKLPAKATLPLIITFLGLLALFLAPALFQLSGISTGV